MLIQDLISKFTTTNIDFKTLAKSYFELSTSKSREWMRRLDLIIEATSVDDAVELESIINNGYSDIIDTALPLEDGSAISLRELAFSIADETLDPETHMLYDKLGNSHSLSEITQYMSDQGVNLTAQICAFQAIMDASVDEVTGQSKVQFANYYTLVQSQLGELSQRGKSIINYYYNILSDSTMDMTTKLELALAPIQQAVTNYNENDSSLNVEFFVPQVSYTGISSFTAWCISNDISWSNTWNSIKSGFKVVGTVIDGLWKGISGIANKIFGYATKPFTVETGILKQRAKYTTNFIDIPVAQGKTSLTKLFSTPLSLADSRTINTLALENNYNVQELQQYINDKINSQSLTSIDFTSFRLLLWQDNDDSEEISFIINVSPIATGSIHACPSVFIGSDGDFFRIERGINESLNEYNADIIGDNLDLNNAADTLSGILASLNNIALITGAAVLTETDLNNPVCDLSSESTITSSQYNDFVRISSFIGGYKIIQLPDLTQRSESLGYANQYVNYGTNGDWLKAQGSGTITNADVVRVICGSNFDVINDSLNTSFAQRGRGLVATLCWLFIRQHFSSVISDQSIYIPYTHIYSTGTPRFIVAGDPSGAAFSAWLTVATVLSVAIVTIGVSSLVRRKKRRKLATWQAAQWSATDTMANNPIGSTAYRAAQSQLVKANRKIQRIESFLEITGTSSLTGLASGIDLTGSSTDAIVKLISGQ